jgi:hypothetical protein
LTDDAKVQGNPKYDQKMTVPRQIIKAELHKIRRSFEPKMTEAEMRAASLRRYATFSAG